MHMKGEAVSDQGHADHQQEARGKHGDRWISVDETGQRIGGEQHHCDGNDDRNHHDRQMLGHADRGDDAVDGEHQVEQQDLPDGGCEADRYGGTVGTFMIQFGIDIVMDLPGGFPDQEQPAGYQDQVTPRKVVAKSREQGFCQLDNEGNGAEQPGRRNSARPMPVRRPLER